MEGTDVRFPSDAHGIFVSMDRQALAGYLAEGLSLAKIAERHDMDASTVGKMAKRHGLRPGGRERYAAKPLDPALLRRKIEEGATLRGLAAHFGVTVTTVRRHLERNGLTTIRAGRRGARRVDDEPKPRTQALLCKRHGKTTFQLEGRGYYRCLACRADAVQRRRRKVKALLVAEAGGACVLCGYGGCVRALHFHHRDPEAKSFALSGHGYTHGIAALRVEARKCLLLCSNCHAEVESGVAELPHDLRPQF